jgi:hypothetical protein
MAIAAVALALSPARAMANCAFDARIAFSYPNETTREVPLNAVFWAVPDDGSVFFRLDGVELQPLDDSPEGQFQFVPTAPLSPGMHDVEIMTRLTAAGDEAEPLHFRVNAVEQAPLEADATIEEVSYFPVGVDATVQYPPPEANEESCEQLGNVERACNDIIPHSITRIRFSTRGDALGYLLGRDILAPGCNTHFPYEFSAGQSSPYVIRAILPTGLSPARFFEVDAGLVATVAPPAREEPAPFQPPPSGPRVRPAPNGDSCAMSVPANGVSGFSLLWFAAAAAVAARFRRR